MFESINERAEIVSIFGSISVSISQIDPIRNCSVSVYGWNNRRPSGSYPLFVWSCLAPVGIYGTVFPSRSRKTKSRLLIAGSRFALQLMTLSRFSLDHRTWC